MTRSALGQHKDPTAPVELPRESRPAPGSIAIYPEPVGAFVAAIESGGGTVAALSDETRGLVWLGGSGVELAQVLDAHPLISWVQLPLAGVESFAPAFARNNRQPLWTSAKGAYAEPVAEHALALLLAVLRQLPEKARSKTWAVPRQGISLFGLNVVIVGAGGVAIELVRLLEPFEVSVTIVRRTAEQVPGAARTFTADRLLDVLPDADAVILAAAATESTASLIGATELAAMKPTAALVNIARGSLVDQDALVVALDSGHLWGAALDVTVPEPLPDSHPLWSTSRCIITSHTADTDEMVEPLLAARVQANVEAFLESGRFVGLVDPEAGY